MATLAIDVLPRETSPGARAFSRLLRRPSAVLGFVVVAGVVAVAVSAPCSPPTTRWPPAGARSAKRRRPRIWFGTDEIGRDVFSRVIWGARASLLAGLVSVCISMALGVPIGLLAAYVGGWTDGLISRFTDSMLAAVPDPRDRACGVPGPEPHQRDDRHRRFGHADLHPPHARAGARREGRGLRRGGAGGGNPHWRIALRHILPNVVPPLIVQATLAIAAAVIAEASLSFLGLGQQPPAPSWGSMLNTAKNYVDQAPWMAVWPGLSIFVLVLSFNLLGDGLRDALDPRHA